MIKVALVLINYNGMTLRYGETPMLVNTIKYLKSTNFKQLGFVVVDNGSTDNSREFLKRENVDIISRKKNIYNFSKVANMGIRYVLRRYNPDYLVIMSNDVFLKDHNWLKKMMDVMEKDRTIGIQGPKEIYPNGKTHATSMIFGKLFPYTVSFIGGRDAGKIMEADAAGFPICLLRREVIDKIGVLDEMFYMGCEDADLSVRAHKAGFKILYNGRVSVVHLGSFSTKSKVIGLSDLNKFYIEQRNKIYFLKKYRKDYAIYNYIGALFLAIMASFITRKKGDTHESYRISLRDRPLKRLLLTFRALYDAG